MNSFKVWLELTQGSDPSVDQNPTQTNQATTQVAQDISKSPRFASIQAQLLRQRGMKDSAQKTLVQGTTSLMNMNSVVPPQVAAKTDVPRVTFALQNMIGGNFGIPKPKVSS